jgi:hypothetical protein
VDDEIVGKGTKRNYVPAQPFFAEVAIVQMVDAILPPPADFDPRKHGAAIAHSF